MGLEDLDLNKVLKPNYLGFLAKGAALPLRTLELLRSLVRIGDFSAMDIGVGLAEALPTGLYSGSGLSDYVEEVLGTDGRVNDFRLIDPELYLTATDLDTCERIVFGEEGWSDVPISKAVECSTCLPVVYKPVDLKGRQFVDGGIRSTTNVDIAVEKGAKFIVVVNPLVPYVNDFEKTIPTVFGRRVRRVSDMGLPAIANQTFRLIAHQRLHQAVEQWQEKYPGVDIILLEPQPNDELMFGTPIMDYSRRLKIARHGFESVTATLAQDYEPLQGAGRAPRPRNLREPSPPRRRESLRGRARADLRLAPSPRADHLGPAAPVRRGVVSPAAGGVRWGSLGAPPPRGSSTG